MKHEPIESFEYLGQKINIYYDNNSDSPDEWYNEEVFIVYDHRDFYVNRKYFDPEDIFEHYQETGKLFYSGYFVFPVYAYIHSGVSLSLSNTVYPFNDRWDVSFKGFALVKQQKGFYHRNKAYEIAESLIQEWNQYLCGDVYFFEINDYECSCGGFYGMKYCIEEAKDEAKYIYDTKRKNYFTQLKTWIKNNVPLDHRKPFANNITY